MRDAIFKAFSSTLALIRLMLAAGNQESRGSSVGLCLRSEEKMLMEEEEDVFCKTIGEVFPLSGIYRVHSERACCSVFLEHPVWRHRLPHCSIMHSLHTLFRPMSLKETLYPQRPTL